MDMDKLVSLCKRRGFLFQSSEIYGGLNGFWDYGPMGVELKRNVKEAWWHDMVTAHDDLATLPGAPSPYQMVGLDCSITQDVGDPGPAFDKTAAHKQAAMASERFMFAAHEREPGAGRDLLDLRNGFGEQKAGRHPLIVGNAVAFGPSSQFEP